MKIFIFTLIVTFLTFFVPVFGFQAEYIFGPSDQQLNKQQIIDCYDENRNNDNLMSMVFVIECTEVSADILTNFSSRIIGGKQEVEVKATWVYRTIGHYQYVIVKQNKQFQVITLVWFTNEIIGVSLFILVFLSVILGVMFRQGLI